MKPFEVIEVHEEAIACEGAGGVLGHPRVYLHIDRHIGEKVQCPYCSRLYVFKAQQAAS